MPVKPKNIIGKKFNKLIIEITKEKEMKNEGLYEKSNN